MSISATQKINTKKRGQKIDVHDYNINDKYEYYNRLNRSLFTSYKTKTYRDKFRGTCIHKKTPTEEKKNTHVRITYHKQVVDQVSDPVESQVSDKKSKIEKFIVLILEEDINDVLKTFDSGYIDTEKDNSEHVVTTLKDYKMAWSFFAERIVFDSLKTLVCSKEFCKLFKNKILANIKKTVNKTKYVWDEKQGRNVETIDQYHKGVYYIENPFGNEAFKKLIDREIACDIDIYCKDNDYVMRYPYQSNINKSFEQGSKFYTCLQDQLRKMNKDLKEFNVKITRAFHEHKENKLAIHYTSIKKEVEQIVPEEVKVSNRIDSSCQTESFNLTRIKLSGVVNSSCQTDINL
jgi:hypothetical protein